MKRWLLLLCAVLLVGLAGASAPHPTRAQSGQLVTIRNGAFSPDVLTITAGDYVDWLNFDSTDHTATSDTGAWDTGTISGVQTQNGVAVTSGSQDIYFNTVGTYAYHDSFDTAIRGTIVVQSGAGTPASSTETSVPAATPNPTAPPATGTPTATATPIATPTIPSGQNLLKQSNIAVATKNTVHAVFRMDMEAPKTSSEVITLTGDISLKPALEHLVGTNRTTQLKTKPAKTTTQREELVVVKTKEATRTGKKPWTCGSAPSSNATSQLLGELGATLKTQSVDDMGAETLGTVPVWHVREVQTLDVGDTSIPITSDYYISQADSTPVRKTVFDSVTASGVTSTARIVADFTKYGEKVKVTLPAACKGKSTASDGLVQIGQYGAQASWTPVWQLRLPRAPGGR